MAIDASKAHHLNECSNAIMQLIEKQRITRKIVSSIFDEKFGSTSKDGGWNLRDQSEATEVATVKFFQHQWKRLNKLPLLEQFYAVCAIQNSIFTQTIRSETQIAFDQYSTPPAISWLCAQMIDCQPKDIILEPHAGTGMLSAFINPNSVRILNELEKGRAELLRAAFPKCKIVNLDALELSSQELSKNGFNKIVMNPPFNAVKGCAKKRGTAERHLLAMINLLSKGGTLVAVMPGSFGSSGKSKNLLKMIKEKYQVSKVFKLSEPFYRSHGVNFPMKLICLENIRPSKATFFGKL